MSIIKKALAIMLTLIMVVCVFSISSFALTNGYDNPLTVEVIAKDSYGLMEAGSITVKATNTGKSNLTNVVLTADSNDLLFLNKSGQKYLSVGTLEKGKSASWTFQVILSSNCNGLGFFQRLLLTLKKLFNSNSSFNRGYNSDAQAVSLASKQINYAGVTANINAYAYYDSISKVVNATDIDSFSSAVSSLIKAQMDDESFDSYAAEQNDYYSGRIVLKGKDVEFEDCDAETIIVGPDDTYIFQFDSPAKAISFQSEQNNKSNVEFAEPDTYEYLDPNERVTSEYDSSYASNTFNSWGVEHIEANILADYLSANNYSSEIIVAVVDTGVDNTHSYLTNKLVHGYDYVDSDNTPFEDFRGTGHGTHVSGTIIDCTPELNVKIMPIRVLGLNGSGSASAIALGIKYAAEHNARVINLSLGGKHNKLKEDAIEYAVKKGVTVCVAAGNEYDDTFYHCPSHITTSGCVCVSAIDNKNNKADFSNYGLAVDVGAPGVNIKSCVPGGIYESWNGTSMATPHVSACAAMLKLLNPSATPSQIENYIRQYTLDIGTSGRDNYFGYGVPKMSKAIPKTNYTVTFNANGGSVSPASATVESGSSVSLPTPTKRYTITYNANSGSGAPSAQYFNASCKGWSTSSSATSASYSCGSSYTPINSITLYAVWGNATGTVTTTTPTREGYTFAGWSTSSSSTAAVEYTAGSSITLSKNTTLYAVWSKNPSKYTISYNANGGSNPPADQTKTENIDLILSTTTPTRTGYDFLGWSTSSSATSATYSAGGTYTTNASATLYAVWKIKTYTISYNANGGSGAPSSQTKTYGQSLTLSSTKPTRTGYDFLGWSTSSSATSATYSAGGTYTTNASATLYAVWKIKTYTISYNANGGSGAPSSQTKTYGQNLTLSSTKPTRSGYGFKGWSTSSSATSATYSAGGTYTSNSSATLYAVWAKSTITLSYYSKSEEINIEKTGYQITSTSVGWKVPLPTVTRNNFDSTSGSGWEVVSGSAQIVDGTVYQTQPGTVKLRYKCNGVYSDTYTYTLKLYKVTSATNNIRNTPDGSITGSVPSGTKVYISQFQYHNDSNAQTGPHLWGKVTYNGVTGWITCLVLS